MRPTRAEVDLGAVAHNLTVLAALAPGSTPMAVVKAGGYGHGAVAVARAALGAGAGWLAVATVEEAVELARGGIHGVPVLVLSELDPAVATDAVVAGWPDLRPTVCTEAGVAAVAAAGVPDDPVRVHLKIDTGMHRMGVDPAGAVALARAVAERPELELEGTWTHLAVADDPDDPFTDEQLRRFDAALAAIRAAGVDPGLVHVANSAATIAHPGARRDLVRLGIALYGVAPAPALTGRIGLRPALRLVSAVSAVRTVAAGEGVSYGRRWRASEPTRVATVPVGYADGVRRDGPARGVEVLVGGRRRPMLGVVTMDQTMVAVDDAVAVGDEVVVIGRQGDEEVTAAEIAERLDTIAYEVLTSLGPRVPRVVVGRGPGGGR